jgi:hypothetical protein
VAELEAGFISDRAKAVIAAAPNGSEFAWREEAEAHYVQHVPSDVTTAGTCWMKIAPNSLVRLVDLRSIGHVSVLEQIALVVAWCGSDGSVRPTAAPRG